MKNKYALRRCVICPNDFTPTREDQRTCGFKCARTLAGLTLKAKGTPAPLARQHQVNAAHRDERIQRACDDRFGYLTQRERDLFGFAHAAGYNRGYSRGYTAHRNPRKKAGAA
jgi:hypothetical protein